MACNCQAEMDKQLVKHNTALDYTISLNRGYIGVNISTVKVDSSKRGKPRKVVASFCPFCGIRYKEPE